jgi:peptide/nickel transport system ATP-binding protein
MALLEVSHLITHFKTPNGVVRAVNDVSFDVQAGETLCLVGESGSGKSVAAMSILQLLDGASHPGGTITFNGTEMLSARESEIRRLRGSEIAMIFQEPLTSLNPVMRVGAQIEEAICAHEGVSRKAARERAAELLSEVGIPDPVRRLDEYPHQFSGGMRQRVMIAMALALRPKLLIADEPTTALDATIQAQILELLRRMQREHGMALLFITHDMGVVAQMADRVAVMYAGRIVEQGPAGQVFADPLMPYTWSLLESVPRLDAPASRFFSIPGAPPRTTHQTKGCPFQPRCLVAVDRCATDDPPLLRKETGRDAACLLSPEEFRAAQRARPRSARLAEQHPRSNATARTLLTLTDLTKVYQVSGFGRRSKPLHALAGVTLDVRAGETVGLVGESGCGKSTLAQLVVRLTDPTGGEITFDGQDLRALHGRTLRKTRRDIQLVGQDPFASLDPRMSVRQVLAEPLKTHHYQGSVDKRVDELLDKVGLAASDARKFPHEFSGGQRQRIAIARAIASGPKLIVLDEPVSALDVSVRSQVLNLLADLQRDLGLAYLFISHDLAVVRNVCARVAVMYLGRIVEQAESAELFERPRHPYTIALLSAIPIPDPVTEGERQRVILRGEVPSPASPPPGCSFHTRCPRAADTCAQRLPVLEDFQADGHAVRCLFPVLDGQAIDTRTPGSELSGPSSGTGTDGLIPADKGA